MSVVMNSTGQSQSSMLNPYVLAEAGKHRAGNNCPVFPAIITTERDGYFEVATIISRTMLRRS